MRIGIVAVIHANLPALVRVLTKLREHGAAEALWCLGDSVGYGPYPNDCLDLLRAHSHHAVPGNHDHGVIGRTDAVLFNDAALWVLTWTQQQLTRAHWPYLESLPVRVEVPDAPF